jgi:5-formyltetrahydrofolate cyclo-ligase
MDKAALQAERSAIRAAMRAWRMQVPEAECSAASKRAGQNLEKIPAFAKARVVAGYRPVRGEIDPGSALARVANAGATVAWPRVMPDGVTIAFHRVRTSGDWVKGSFGIWEPSADAPELGLDAIECFVVPGLAFDRTGGRLGQGGGHYDRVMAFARERANPAFIGFAFAHQVIPSVPQMAHDARVDWLVSETEHMACNAAV